MEVDGDFEMIPVSKATGPFLYRCDFRVQSFGYCVGNAMLKISQDVGQVSGKQLCLLDHGRQAAVRRPEIPAVPEAL